MDAYEALKETFDDLFQQAVEEGCYTEDEAAELVESLDIYSLLQVVRPQCHNGVFLHHPGQAGTVLQLPGRGPVPPGKPPCCMRKPTR